MRVPIPVFLSLLALTGVVWLTCRSAPAPRQPRQPWWGQPWWEAGAGRAPKTFSANRAWKHLEALAAIGPRASGTEGAAKARAYLRDELTSLGLEVVSQPATVSFDSADVPGFELVNLEVTIPGDSPDLIVLAAPYDSAFHESFAFRGVNDGASGAALLLEFARVLRSRPLPYTIRLYFLDGEAPLGRGSAEDAETRLLGSMAAAGALESERKLAAIRLLLLVNRVSDADLRIARDRFSHRTYRDAIWRAAAELGYADVFPPGARFDAPVAGHRSFIDLGMRRTVAIVDPHFGDGEAPDLADHTEEDTLDRSSHRSLEIVGKVTLAGLESITARLVKIDRFSQAPVVVEPEVPVIVEPEAPVVVEPEAPAGAEPTPPETASEAAPRGDSPGVEGPQETEAP